MRAAFIESKIEIEIWDDSATNLDDHEIKLWIHRAFKELSCYQISEFERDLNECIQATVALKTSHLSPANQSRLIQNSEDPSSLQAYIQAMFSAEGSCKCLGTPRITFF